MVDDIPPETTFVVSVLVGHELLMEEHGVFCSKAVLLLQIPGDVFWLVGTSPR